MKCHPKTSLFQSVGPESFAAVGFLYGVFLSTFWIPGQFALAQTQDDQQLQWQTLKDSAWSVENNLIKADVDKGSDASLLLKAGPTTDVMIQTEVRFAKASKRQNFGVILRKHDGGHLAVRYYDQPRALELLEFSGEAWQRRGGRSVGIDISADTWLNLKVMAVDRLVLAKLWPHGQQEPDWQLRVDVKIGEAGVHGLLVHDAGKFEFRNFSLSHGSKEIEKLRQELVENRRKMVSRMRDSLKLAVAANAFPNPKTKTRTVEVVPFADADRFPLEGVLSWIVNNEKHQRRVLLNDYRNQAIEIDVPEPSKRLQMDVTFAGPQGIALSGRVTMEPAQINPWRYYVEQSVNTLIDHGRDEYGSKHSPLIMAVLDTTTLRSPRRPQQLDATVRLEKRIHRRGERGSNLWYDQALINAMHRLTATTTNKKYSKAADEYVKYFLENCYKPQDGRHAFHTGLPAWGTHIYWSCYEERPAGDLNGSGPHEILLFRANWRDMYEKSPEGVRRIAERVWAHHIVDKSTGLHNRHDDGKPGCDFAFSGGSFVHLFAEMYQMTEEAAYLEKAKTVADWHWKNRNQKTNLPADCPGITDRYDGKHTFTTVSGPHAMLLLEAYRASGDKYFFEIASTYIKAYDRFAWDDQRKSYYAMLTLDGKPLPDRPKGGGYGAYAPYGHVNVWRTTFYSYEFTFSAAQAAMLAYELSGTSKETRDPQLLAIAKRWGAVIEKDFPPRTGRRWKKELEQSMPLAVSKGGAYAEDYGRGISFFVHLYRATNDKRYLGLAEQLAADSVRKLYHNGLFKGHAAKPYYETTNGVGLLLYALLELDTPDEPLNGAY